ncbi:hypothetical protein ACO0QE_001895 [Hanseniaspora vineae]
MSSKQFARTFHSTTSCHFLFKKATKHLANTAPKEYTQFQLKTPCGLAEPPKHNIHYHEGNSMKEMFDDKKTAERTKELEKEFQQSGFHDLYAFEKTKGKLFISPLQYWKKSYSKYFPHMVGQQLSTKKENVSVEDCMRGKVTVLKMCGNKVGEDMVNTFFIKDKDNYLENPEKILSQLNTVQSDAQNNTAAVVQVPAQIVEINLIDNAMKLFLFRFFGNNLSKLIPKQRQDKYFICNRNQLPFGKREAMNINNVYSGYVFVIDPSLKIRWMACGSASSEEFETLWNTVRAVQKETL